MVKHLVDKLIIDKAEELEFSRSFMEHSKVADWEGLGVGVNSSNPAAFISVI